MKLLFGCLVCSLILAGYAAKLGNVSTANSVTTTETKVAEKKDELPEGATKAEYTLKRVIFQDGTRWNAGD